MKTEAAARVRAYLARHAKNRQGDPRAIHGYDLGEPSEAELLVADLKLLASPEAPAEGVFKPLFTAVAFADEYNRLKPDAKKGVKEFILDSELRAIHAALTPRHEAPACPTCGGKGYTEHEGGDGEGYPSRPEIEDCPKCHEAPAEGAGEMDDDDASTYAPSVAGLSDYLWNQAQAADSVEGRCILEMWREAVDAIRARSSAPEANL